MKDTITLDFDGVVHQYITPWESPEIIPDPAVEGAIEWLLKAMNHYEVAIFSARSIVPGGIVAMQNWLRKELVKWLKEPMSFKELQSRYDLAGYVEDHIDERMNLVEWTNTIINRLQWPISKIPSKVYIDDNGYRFNGRWPSFDELDELESWVKE